MNIGGVNYLAERFVKMFIALIVLLTPNPPGDNTRNISDENCLEN